MAGCYLHFDSPGPALGTHTQTEAHDEDGISLVGARVRVSFVSFAVRSLYEFRNGSCA